MSSYFELRHCNSKCANYVIIIILRSVCSSNFRVSCRYISVQGVPAAARRGAADEDDPRPGHPPCSAARHFRGPDPRRRQHHQTSVRDFRQINIQPLDYNAF
jgi:hypothetical protein